MIFNFSQSNNTKTRKTRGDWSWIIEISVNDMVRSAKPVVLCCGSERPIAIGWGGNSFNSN
jgi:hypothetical protein